MIVRSLSTCSDTQHQNSIKAQARERDGFRRQCVTFAQWLHRVDMNMRLGILHDAAAQERMYAREAAEAAAKKRRAETSTVLTEAQQKAADAEATAAEKTKDKDSKSKDPPKPKIRPLSESRAIELGANFLAESFVFMVAAGLLVFERWWSKRKETKREDVLIDRLEALEAQNENTVYLEAEVLRLRADLQTEQAIRLAQTKGAGGGKSPEMLKMANPPMHNQSALPEPDQ